MIYNNLFYLIDILVFLQSILSIPNKYKKIQTIKLNLFIAIQ